VVFEGFAKGLSFPITADITGLVKAIGQADLELAKVDKAVARGQKVMEGYGNSMQSLGKQMSWQVTAPIVAIGTASVYTAAQFDDSMRKVQAKVGGTTEDLAAMREQALQLGADTAWSASEAADGMEYLAAAGFNAEQVMAAMPGMLALASSDAVDLGVAAEIAGATLNGFGLEAAEAGRVADVLAKSAAATNAGVTDMGNAMAYVAPVARATGLSLEETAAAIGIMSNAGIKGSMAGTALRGSLTALMSPSNEAADIMKRYNLQLNTNQAAMNAANTEYEKANSKLNGYKSQLETATQKLKDMKAVGTFSKEQIAQQTASIESLKKSISSQKDEVDKLEKSSENLASQGLVPLNEIVKQFADSGMSTAEIMTIFGDRAGPGMLALIQEGQGGLVDMTAELENSAGAAQEMADLMESGPGGAFRQLEGSIETVSIAIGDALIPALLPLMDIIKGVADWLGSLDKNTLTIIVTIAAFAAAVGPLLIVLGMVVSSIGSIITIIPVLMAGLTLLAAHPVVLVIVGLVAILYILETRFGVLSIAAGVLSDGFTWLATGIGEFVDWVANAVNWSDVLYNAFLILLGPIGWIQLAMNALGVSWDDVWDGMVSGMKWAINIMIDGFNALIDAQNAISSLGGINPYAYEIPNIPRLAAGGIVTQPTVAMIGEAGPEAVVPLTGSNTAGMGGVTIRIDKMEVRNDQDVHLVARELYTLIDRQNRGRGAGA
jgi:TP901 family phage tail tape measure protein